MYTIVDDSYTNSPHTHTYKHLTVKRARDPTHSHTHAHARTHTHTHRRTRQWAPLTTLLRRCSCRQAIPISVTTGPWVSSCTRCSWVSARGCQSSLSHCNSGWTWPPLIPLMDQANCIHRVCVCVYLFVCTCVCVCVCVCVSVCVRKDFFPLPQVSLPSVLKSHKVHECIA